VVKKVGFSAYKLKSRRNYPQSSMNQSCTTTQQQAASLTVVAPSQEGAIKILNSRRQGDELQYLVKWQGQPFKESTWEDRCKIVKRASCLC